MKLSGTVSAYCVLKDSVYLSFRRASENFSEKGMTKHMHMRHMYISIAAVTMRLLIMAVLLSSLFPDSLRDEGIIAPRSRFVNSYFEKIFLRHLKMRLTAPRRMSGGTIKRCSKIVLP